MNRLVLLVELGHVGDKVLDDVHWAKSVRVDTYGIERTVGKRIDLGVLAGVPVDSAKARKGVLAVDVHGARATDTLTTGSAEGESRVHLILDLDECVEHLGIVRQLCMLQHAYTRTNHRACLVEINLV